MIDEAAIRANADGSALLTTTWGDDEHVFRLGLREIRQLQAKVDCGPEMLYSRIRAGNWYIDDLKETIRLGLIGGGMDEVKAANMMRDHFLAPYLQHKPIAQAILLAALVGPPDDQLGKAGRGGETKKTRKAKSPSPPVSEMPAQSA